MRADADLVVQSLPIPRQVSLLEDYATTGGLELADHSLDRGGLARAIVAEKGEDFSAVHLHAQIIDRLHIWPVILRQVLESQNIARTPLLSILFSINLFKVVKILHLYLLVIIVCLLL